MPQSSRLMFAAALLAGVATAAPLAAQQDPPPQLSLGGVAFAQFAGQLGTGTNSNFDVTRAYLNVKGKFAGGIATRITGDIYTNTEGSHGYRLKYAYVNWTPSGSALTYRLGLMTTPWVDWEEALWGYRMQGPVAVDRNHYLTSSDFGAGIDGNINHEQVDFQVAVTDGTGYGATPGDQHKAVAGRASVRLVESDDGSRVGGLRLTGFAQLGAPNGGGTRQRYIGMLSFHSKQVTLAGEYGAMTDSAAASTSKLKGRVISAYGVAQLPRSPVAIIARVDLVDPNTSAPNDKSTDIIAGLSYQLTPNVRILADVDNRSFEASGVKAVTQALFQTQFTF